MLLFYTISSIRRSLFWLYNYMCRNNVFPSLISLGWRLFHKIRFFPCLAFITLFDVIPPRAWAAVLFFLLRAYPPLSLNHFSRAQAFSGWLTPRDRRASAGRKLDHHPAVYRARFCRRRSVRSGVCVYLQNKVRPRFAFSGLLLREKSDAFSAWLQRNFKFYDIKINSVQVQGKPRSEGAHLRRLEISILLL